MRQDNRNSRFSGGYNNQHSGGQNFNNNRGFSGNNRNTNDRTMYSAVCDECGNACEVPFQPTSGKPIYCDICFSKNKNRGGARDGNRNDSRPRNNRSFDSNRNTDHNQYKVQLDSLNMKLDQILSILKAPPTVKTEKIEAKPSKTIKSKNKAVKKPVKKIVKKTVKKVVKTK